MSMLMLLASSLVQRLILRDRPSLLYFLANMAATLGWLVLNFRSA
jgi:hypothetical protein